MKFAVSCLVGLMAVVYTNAALSTEQLEKIKAVAASCKEKTKATDDDMATLKKHEMPETKTGQCFVACMNKDFGVMTADNKMDIDHIKEITTHLKEKNPEKYATGMKVLETCAAELTGESDECEAARKMMDCCKKEAAAAGLKLSDFMDDEE